MNKSRTLCALLVLLLGCPGAGQGYDLLTHEEINVGGARESSLKVPLREELVLLNGVEEVVDGKRVIDWIRAGGRLEDRLLRPLNHFHHPLRSPWRDAGLKDRPFFGNSSVLWGQNPSQGQDPDDKFSWIDARDSYLSALTLPEKGKRETAFGRTFRALGQMMHLIADASVPAHVRNDQHFLGDPYEEWVEGQAGARPGERPEEAAQRFLGSFAPSPKGPDDSFTLTLRISGEDAGDAPIPIARLWDTDLYDGTNPARTLSARIGMTEYANANFFSDDTVFSDQRSPAHKHFSPFPSSADVEMFTDTSNNRKYWRKRGATQEEPQHLAVVSKRFFWQQSSGLDVPKRGRLDEKVHEDYARLLLPRAVGYSAALLDYFFRGKLDADLVNPDSNDPALFRLVGTNGSSDELVDGTLTLYADDPLGVRTQVTSLSPVNLGNVAPGGGISSPSFQPPENAERFVAVYQGTLGLEAKDPGRNFPGGVIGKVVGGVRVEEVFLEFDFTLPDDSGRWKLRTPKGVFPLKKEGELPLTGAEFEKVRWGDGDNLLVAQTAFEPNKPNRVVAYEVPRQSNSVDLVAVGPPDALEVVLTKKNEAVLPFGMPLGTTVNFSHTIHYRQQVAVFSANEVWALKPMDPPDPNFPDAKACVFDHSDRGAVGAKTVAAQDVSFQGSFRVTLDLARNGSFGTVGRPYVWSLQEVGATVDGRLLGLVVVDLTYPEGPAVSVPVIGLNRFTGGEEVVSESGFSPTFPPAVGSPIWALVDLKTGEVVASTADPVLTMTGEEAFEGVPDVWVHGELDFCGEVFTSWVKAGSFESILRPGDIVNVDAVAQPIRNGLFGLTVSGWLKGELNSLEVNGQLLFGVQLATQQESFEVIYDCILSGDINVCRAMRVNSTTGFLARGPAGLDEVRRSRPAPGGERLVFLAGAGRGTTTAVATVVVWDAPAGRAQVRHQFLEDVPEVGPATGGTLLATTLFLGGEQLVPRASFLIPLEGTQGVTDFPGVDLRESFVLLSPSYLYSLSDLRFFRPKPPLQRTALPAKLVDVPGNPVGDYHAIRLP